MASLIHVNPNDPPDEIRKANLERLAVEYQARACQRTYWEQLREALAAMKPVVCFSRKVGTGALEVAGIMAAAMDYRVIDREIIEAVADRSRIDLETAAAFDESCPGYVGALMQRLTEGRSFPVSRYSENLFAAIFFLASAAPTIFVGRGTHLVLPREKVFAVRCISSRAYRIERIGRMRGIPREAAAAIVDQADADQKRFFRKVYRQRAALPAEFDVVINFDHLHETGQVAEALVRLFSSKFGPAPA